MNIYNELPLDNFIRFLNYHGWYKKEKFENWGTYIRIHVTPEIKTYSIFIPEAELLRKEDSVNWKENAIETISQSHNRSLLSVAGEIADFHDTQWRTINIRNVKVLEKIIPRGDYCYDENGTCPFLTCWDEMGKQNNGYCNLLQKGDWHQNGTNLLWDQCKSCRINNSEEYLDSDKIN
jgi:hypothetical protein